MLKATSYSSFDELPPAYLRLFEQWGARSFYYGIPWYKNFVRTVLDADDRVRVYGVEKNDGTVTPVAALPTRHKVLSSGRFRVSRLSSLTNFYTSLYGPVLDNSAEACGPLRELARAICSDTPPWDIVDMKPLDVESPCFNQLVEAFRSAGMVVQAYFCFGNWYLPVGGRTYREYFEALPDGIKSTVRRKSRKLERLGHARYALITGPEALEEGIRAYEQVYRASWKTSEPYPEFIRGLMRTCAEMGWLRLGLTYVGDEPAGAELCLVNGGVASSFKAAYDTRFSSLSVGTVMTARLLEHVIDVDKVHEVDFLTGDESYKTGWMTHRRERWGIMAFNPRTFHGCLSMLRHVGGRRAKGMLRNLLRRAPGESGRS